MLIGLSGGKHHPRRGLLYVDLLSTVEPDLPGRSRRVFISSQSCRYGALDPSVISGLHGLFVPAQDTISCMHDTLDQNGDANSMLMLIIQQLVIEFPPPDYGTRRLSERTLCY